MSFSKPKSKYNNIIKPEKERAWMKAIELISSHNPWIDPEDLNNLGEPINMSEEELYYIASIISELKTLKQQRALIDVIHIKCDEDTVTRFMSYFSSKNLKKIMLNC